jgi:hypothetical protein
VASAVAPSLLVSAVSTSGGSEGRRQAVLTAVLPAVATRQVAASSWMRAPERVGARPLVWSVWLRPARA